MKKQRSSTTLAATLFMLLILVFLLDVIFRLFSSPSHQSSNILQEQKHLEEASLKSSEPPKSISCDRSHREYDLCHLNRPTVMDPRAASLFVLDPTVTALSSPEKIRPYPRKWQNDVMSTITELSLIAVPSKDTCAVKHDIPALVFSAGGYTGNFFHEFNDGFIPVFITARSIFSNQDIALAVVNCQDWWLAKYAALLRRFSRHPVINLDRENATHCFSSAAVGLISHGPMTVNPLLFPALQPYTLSDFRELLISAYGSRPLGVREIEIQPQLVLFRRRFNRIILNEDDVRRIADEIGFKVVVFEPSGETQLDDAVRLMGSTHAILGVHGAALTHEMFLRKGTVVLQVVPVGLNWMADVCFGKAANQLGLEYMEYYVETEESISLVEKYGRDSLEVNNPGAVVNGSWANMRKYLEQAVELDLVRLRIFLLNAYEKAKRFILMESLSLE